MYLSFINHWRKVGEGGKFFKMSTAHPNHFSFLHFLSIPPIFHLHSLTTWTNPHQALKRRPAASSVSFGMLLEHTWWFMKSMFWRRAWTLAQRVFFGTSDAIKIILWFVLTLLILSCRTYIIINEQLEIWHKLWLTPCLMLVKKAIKFLNLFCFCFYFLIYIFHTQRWLTRVSNQQQETLITKDGTKTHHKKYFYYNNNNKQNAGKNKVIIKLLWNENKKAVII